MGAEAKLEIAAGFVSDQGRRPDNQDFGALYLGSDGERARCGIAVAVADGVGGTKGGRAAAETIVRGFIDGYYGQPETLGIAAAVERTLGGLNRWLHQMGRSDPTMEGAATTFTGLVLRGRRATVLHVGDSRAWHFRGGVLTRLTQDHTLPQPDLAHVLYRAVGIEPVLRLDRAEHDLAVHDRLLLTSDGVHGALGERAIARLLAQRESPQSDARALVDAALAAGSQDNATALLIDVVELPPVDHDAIAAAARALPVPPPPAAGEMVDGYRLDTVISEGRYTRVFRCEDIITGAAVVLKFPKPALLSEAGARLAFLREALIGARVRSPFVGTAAMLAPERQSRLYIAMPFYPGETLEARIARTPPTIRAGIEIAAKVGRGLAALHRLDIIHRDIKPENILLSEDGGLKIIDLGVARLPRVDEFARDEEPGTPSYMAPELFDGAVADAATDQFALGVTLYRMFTGRYPYGEIEPFSRPRFDRPVAPSRWRADMPAWLEAAILRAVSVNPARRFGDVFELVHMLESGPTRPARPLSRRPLLERDPVRFWQMVALMLAIGLVAALAAR